jgi:putative phosphoesterase
MLVVVSDTHREAGHGLEGPLLEAVREADRVVHAGDFTAEEVVDAFADEATRLDAVHGNVDTAAVQGRLPAERTLEYAGTRVVVTHQPEGGETGMAMLGRSRDADLVVFGHTHRPTVVDAGDVTLCNPGSHVQPRQFRAAYATLEPSDGSLSGRLHDPDGDVFETFVVG